MKPVLYGSLAAHLAGIPHVINALTGMGWLFTSASGFAQCIQVVVRFCLGLWLRRTTVLVQNPDDVRMLQKLGIAEGRIRLTPGSGVDTETFRPGLDDDGVPNVVLPARLLWDKGVGEFVAAADSLKKQGIAARFWLAGEPDPENPSSVPQEEIRGWVAEGIVEHLGWVTDMAGLLSRAHLVCLPSYREGLPKSLIEAAAAGRPIVTTDVPGCRDVVRDGYNGILVPARDSEALAEALARLIGSPAVRREMGRNGRARAIQEFGLAIVVKQILSLYAECLRRDRQNGHAGVS
jgi:glycosyltransferase involved in cell wall biosynthesis